MRSLLTLSFLLLMCHPSFAQDSGTKVGYDISSPNYRYGTKVSSIQNIDFKNIKVFSHESGVKLRDGSSRQKLRFGYEEVHLDLSEFLTSPDDANRAVIDLEWHDCGASCTVIGHVQVFELQSGHPIVVQEIEYDRQAPGTGVRFDRQSQMLTLTGRSSERTEHLQVMHFAWDGKQFVFKDVKTEASAGK